MERNEQRNVTVKKQRTKRSAQVSFDTSIKLHHPKTARKDPVNVGTSSEEQDLSSCYSNDLDGMDDFFENETTQKLPERKNIHSDNNFGCDDALNYISAIFLKNNISENLGKDIFMLSGLLKTYSSIRFSHVKKRIEEWKSHEKRAYSFCCSCENMLSDSMRCQNRSCSRYMTSQWNIAGNKTIVTFSVRSQLEHLLHTGVIDLDDALEHKSTSLCSQLKNTPKFQKRAEEVKILNPNKITLLMSLNTDGFRRRGSKRGEFWPLFLAVHNISKGQGNYREYRPEFIILSAMLQTGKILKRHDFLSVFERLNLEIESIRRNPLVVTTEQKTYQIVVDLFQCVLDMDASRKIHGVPVWLSYSSCSRCTVKGTPVKLKKRKTISWYPLEPVIQYKETIVPPKFIPSRLPPPWKDGYDGLHLIYEGTSRDMMREVLGKGERTKRSLQPTERRKWALALERTCQARGMCSTALLDPIQLTSRTGSEIQQLFDISIPTMLICIDKFDIWTFMVFIHWLSTRIITDHYLCPEQCEILKPLSSCLKNIVGTCYPALYTMKFHFVHDHMVPSISTDGSPLLSSAAPFERLNLVLGRSSNTYTTRATMNMASRFIALQQAAFLCSYATGLKDSPVTIPFTFRAEKDLFPTQVFEDSETDPLPLSDQELEFLANQNVTVGKLRSSAFYNSRFFTIRRYSSLSSSKCSNVYSLGRENKIIFGSIERIVVDSSGDTYVILKKFEVIDPFEPIISWAVTTPEVLQVVQNHKNVKSEKIEDQGNEKIDVWYNGTVNDVHDMENDFDIDDVQFNHSDDEEGTSTGPVKPFFPVRKLANSFSLTADLAGQKPNDPIESLKNHIDAGDVINIGREIQKGIGSGTLTEIQLLEFTQTVPPPQISITSFVNQIEKSDLEDVKSIMVAQHFMNKMKSNVQKSITKFEAKLNSLSSNLDETRHVITKDIEQLMASHIIPAAAPFPTINLAPFFTLKNFAGDKVVNQMTNLYSAIFKKYLPNEYDIWVYSYRPVCAKATDRHFKPLPDTIVEGLQDFGLDVLGAYLPLHLLCGPITETDPFAIALGDDSTAKIEYRRSIRVDMCKLIDSAIGFSLQSLRNNHFDLDLSKLVYCPERKNCLSHYRWDDVKVYRHTRRCAGLDVEAYSIEDVMRACERSTTEPIYDGPQRQNDNGNDVDDTG